MGLSDAVLGLRGIGILTWAMASQMHLRHRWAYQMRG